MSTPQAVSPESYQSRYEEKLKESPVKSMYDFGGEIVTKITSIVHHFCKMPGIVPTAIEGSVYVVPDLADGLMSVYEVGRELQTIVSGKAKKLQRFAASLAIVEKIGVLTLSVASAMNFFKGVGLAKGRAIRAIPIVAAVAVVLTALPGSIVSVVRLSKALRDLDKVSSRDSGARMSAIRRIAGDVKLLERDLRLSKVAIKKIQDGIACGNEADVFDVLRGRARIALGFEASSLAAKIVGVIGVVLLATPAIYVGAAFIGVSAAGLVGVGVGRICAFDTDPFLKKPMNPRTWNVVEDGIRVDKFHQLPQKKVPTGVGVASDFVAKIAYSPFFVRDVAKQLRIIFSSRVGALVRFGATCKILEHVGTMVGTASTVVKFAQLLDVIPAALAPCIPFIPIIGIASSILGTVPLGIYYVARSSMRVHRFNQFARRLEDQNADKKDILHDVRVYLEAQKVDRLAKNLYLSTGAKERIEQCMQIVLGEQPGDESESVDEIRKVVTMLRNRSRVILAYDCVGLLSKLVGAVGSVFLATPLAPVGAGLVAASAVGSGGVLAGQLLFLKDNPLDPKSRTRVVKAWNAVKRKIPHFHRTPDAA